MNLYTFKELQEKFNWNAICSAGLDAQKRGAASHGVEIKEVKKENKHGYFEILNNPKNCFTQQQIIDKYKIGENKRSTIPDFLTFAENRGILLKKLTFSKRPYYYEIIDDKLLQYNGVTNMNYPDFEVCKEGYVRNKATKHVYQSNGTNGYNQICYKGNTYVVHRIVLETFNPIENMNTLYVDHINGIRNDNRLENLRGATPETNMIYKQQNGELIQDNFNILLQQIGYEEMNNLLKREINKNK